MANSNALQVRKRCSTVVFLSKCYVMFVYTVNELSGSSSQFLFHFVFLLFGQLTSVLLLFGQQFLQVYVWIVNFALSSNAKVLVLGARTAVFLVYE